MRQTDRITGEDTPQKNRQYSAVMCFSHCLTNKAKGCGAFRDYCYPSAVSVSVNDPPYPWFLSRYLDVGLTWITLSPSLIGLQTAQHQMTLSDHKNQRAIQTPGLIPVPLYSMIRFSGGKSIQICYLYFKIQQYRNVKNTSLGLQVKIVRYNFHFKNVRLFS